MVSNHFPSTFGYKYPWLILAIISLGAAGVKHYLNLREKGNQSVWVMPVSVIILLAACFISAPAKNPNACNATVTMAEVNAYADANAIPKLELYARGYTSIGCEPCTAIPESGADARSGRWGGKKLECGIHTFSEKV